MITIVVAYVPSPDRSVMFPPRIVPGSAIVGPWAEAADGSANRRIYYEGNVVGASTTITYADRVRVAADALVHHFPTSAQARVPAEELLEVAWFVYESSRLFTLDHRALAPWLGFDGERVPFDELVVTR